MTLERSSFQMRLYTEFSSISPTHRTHDETCQYHYSLVNQSSGIDQKEREGVAEPDRAAVNPGIQTVSKAIRCIKYWIS